MRGIVSKQLKSPIFMFTVLGLNMMALLMMIPLWNAAIMLQDPLFSYFLGTRIPTMIIWGCALIVLVYIVTILAFFYRTHEVTHTEQTMLNIGLMFIALMGALALLMAYPMRPAAIAIGTDLMQNSQYSSNTYRIYMTSLELQALRSQPRCISLDSVEDCDGFVQNRYTNLLKHMESTLSCSGWGARANSTQAPTSLQPLEPRPISISAYEYRTKFQHALGASLGQPSEEASKDKTPSSPHTLFSRTEHTSSCDGMAGRKLKYFLEDTAAELFYEGMYLLCIFVAIGFLKLLNVCTSSPTRVRKAAEYGSVEEESLYSGSSPAEVSRVFQGILRR